MKGSENCELRGVLVGILVEDILHVILLRSCLGHNSIADTEVVKTGMHISDRDANRGLNSWTMEDGESGNSYFAQNRIALFSCHFGPPINDTCIRESIQCMLFFTLSASEPTKQSCSLSSFVSSSKLMSFAVFGLVAETINHRIDMLEEKISDSEKRITEQVTDKITKVFDKRMSSEMSRMRKDMDNKIGDLRKEISSEMEGLNGKMEEIAKTPPNNSNTEDIKFNIVIRNLPFNESEDIDRKLSDLLRNGLKIQDSRWNGKKALSDSTPGVVVAKCNSLEDKNRILTAKNQLGKTLFYKKVFIHSDQTKEERQLASNMRLIMNTINNGHSNLRVQGTRVVNNRNEGTRNRQPYSNGIHSGFRDEIHSANSEGANNSCSRSNVNNDRSANRGRGAWGNGGQARGNNRGIAESHLKCNEQIFLNGYKWFGNNRDDIHVNAWSGSGGVGLFVKDNIFAEYDVSVVDPSFE
ncbi:hypothetical protein MAR_014613, partial [Mya arenaria]